MLNSSLISAYRWHRAHPSRVVGAHGLAFPFGFMACDALRLARRDVAGKVERYTTSGKPSPAVAWQPENRRGERLAYVENPEALGLRFVGEVVGDCGGRNGVWNKGDKSGWYTRTDSSATRSGDGLAWGEVYQLPGRKGECRFVAGFRFGGCDGGPTIDFGTVYSEPACVMVPSYSNKGAFVACWDENPRETESANTAARVADSMAKAAAEEERDRDAAYSAGNAWLERKHEVADLRVEALQILKERRHVKGDGAAYPTLCQVITSRVVAIREDMAKKRDEMARLAKGEYLHDWLPGFFAADKRLRESFNEGAGENVI